MRARIQTRGHLQQDMLRPAVWTKQKCSCGFLVIGLLYFLHVLLLFFVVSVPATPGHTVCLLDPVCLPLTQYASRVSDSDLQPARRGIEIKRPT